MRVEDEHRLGAVETRHRRQVEAADGCFLGAFERMVRHAEEMGAGAVIGMRYDATEFAEGVTEVLAYGTAVKITRG